jgi:hypothetical protein
VQPVDGAGFTAAFEKFPFSMKGARSLMGRDSDQASGRIETYGADGRIGCGRAAELGRAFERKSHRCFWVENHARPFYTDFMDLIKSGFGVLGL